jgi:large subunit ribosomal protein L3
MAGKDKLGLFGRKIGMTRVYLDNGVSIPVTAIEVEPSVITQIRTPDRDGYSAVQIGGIDARPRRTSFQIMGHDAKAGTGPKAAHAEYRMDEAEAGEFELGQHVSVEHFAGYKFVDVTGTSKGKGFAGHHEASQLQGPAAQATASSVSTARPAPSVAMPPTAASRASSRRASG